MTEVTIRPASPVPDEPRRGDRAWIGEPHQVLAAALTCGAESRGAGHHGDLMTAVALAVWWQGLSLAVW